MFMEVNFEKKNFDLSEKKILVLICKKLNNFCLDDGKKTFLEKKIYFHKHVLLNSFLNFHQRVLTVEELFAYIFGIYIKFSYKDPSIIAPFDLVSVAT